MKKSLVLSIVLVLSTSCTVQSSMSNHYLTAEKLWTEKNYNAAVEEFDRVVKESPNSALGLQALWRATTTRDLFLNSTEEALAGYETFLARATSSDLAPQALLAIGEIYFSKLKNYPKAIEHYSKLIATKRFSAQEEFQFEYKIGRAYFLGNRTSDAIQVFEKLINKSLDANLLNQVKFDLGLSWYVVGEEDKQGYAKALKYFNALKLNTKLTNPKLYVESQFYEAACLEELDKLEEAKKIFESLIDQYPAPNVIRVRVARLDERMKKKRK